MASGIMQDESTNLNYTTSKNYYVEARRETDSWFFVSHTWPVTLVLLSYAFLIYFDSKFMKQRKPMNLKFLMILFNIYQVGAKLDTIDYLTKYACHPADPRTNHLWHKGLLGARMFLTSKLADLIDTVFIVLRKKRDQLTFLHLYHHVSMVFFSWYCMKYAAGEQLVVIMLINPFIHVIMYSYYTLSLLGKPVQKYLWWKKYITILQLTQFLVYMAYMAVIILMGCNHSVPLTLFIFLQGGIFYALFQDFYNKAYNKNKVSAEVDSNKKVKVT